MQRQSTEVERQIDTAGPAHMLAAAAASMRLFVLDAHTPSRKKMVLPAKMKSTTPVTDDSTIILLRPAMAYCPTRNSSDRVVSSHMAASTAPTNSSEGCDSTVMTATSRQMAR